MSNIEIQQAATSLSQIISDLVPGEHVILVRDGIPVATLTRHGGGAWPCQAGSAKNTRHWMAPDFDAPLDDFRPYMQ
jgi:antitoxin (DNA-binding transcriptional repressor) of toxin-antitoxin stability system